VKFCGACGAPQVPGDQFCQKCGRAYAADEPAQAAEERPVVQSSPPAVAPSPGQQRANADDEPFPSWAPIAAGLAVFFMPFISLIVSLVMRSSEQRPSRRSFLKNWAIASGAWLCTGWLIILLVFASAGSGSGSGVANGRCKNGPDPFNPPSYVSDSTGKHWTAEVPCDGGGSITRPATKSETRFLNSH
jgi:hypothetical protein